MPLGRSYTEPMDDAERRFNPRYSVSLYAEQVEHESIQPRILNLSETGFLLRGDVCAGQGGVIRASFRVHPDSGEHRVTARGRVVHATRRDGEFEFGIRIESFGSPDEEEAYRSYVGKLSLADPNLKGIPSVSLG